MQITQQSISPKRAQELLGTVKLNRNVRSRHVAELARQMVNGEWDPNNPGAIGLTTSGKLLDGQHRLLAVVESGKTIRMWVAEGIPAATMTTIDTGAKRNLADVLKLRGDSSVNALSGTLRQVWTYEHYKVMGGRPPGDPTHGELLRLLDGNETIREIVRRVNASYSEGLPRCGPSLWGAVYYIALGVNEDDADEFMDKVTTGENLGEGDAILALRRFLMEAQGRRPPPRVCAAVMVKAWNAWRKGNYVQVLSFKPGGRSPEKFPELE
jgi:hypothetical protein